MTCNAPVTTATTTTMAVGLSADHQWRTASYRIAKFRWRAPVELSAGPRGTCRGTKAATDRRVWGCCVPPCNDLRFPGARMQHPRQRLRPADEQPGVFVERRRPVAVHYIRTGGQLTVPVGPGKRWDAPSDDHARPGRGQVRLRRGERHAGTSGSRANGSSV